MKKLWLSSQQMEWCVPAPAVWSLASPKSKRPTHRTLPGCKQTVSDHITANKNASHKPPGTWEAKKEESQKNWKWYSACHTNKQELPWWTQRDAKAAYWCHCNFLHDQHVGRQGQEKEKKWPGGIFSKYTFYLFVCFISVHFRYREVIIILQRVPIYPTPSFPYR